LRIASRRCLQATQTNQSLTRTTVRCSHCSQYRGVSIPGPIGGGVSGIGSGATRG